ncbi:hypothetical protein NYR30_04250 [Gallibacterium salpingitidis]|nr:hypothetical protein [Gallibacterium salpingitidis]WKT00505.1 hypothetical protein NYR30_04250 [Gallibacterium salpingitidis]
MSLPYQERLMIYERLKQELIKLNLTQQQYEQRIKVVVEVLGI